MTDFTLTFTGQEGLGLLMHNPRLADPLDEIVREMKKINKKGVNKTDEDHEKIARLEFGGGLYTDEILGPYIPGQNIMKCIVDGARNSKSGPKVYRGIIIKDDVCPLISPGPRDTDKLYPAGFKLRTSMVVGGKRIMRTRPYFPQWEVSAAGSLDTAVLDVEQLKTYIEYAGSYIGLGDSRPGKTGRYGKFVATLEVH